MWETMLRNGSVGSVICGCLLVYVPVWFEYHVCCLRFGVGLMLMLDWGFEIVVVIGCEAMEEHGTKEFKRAPEKNRCLTVNLHHDGVFTVSPFEYSLGDEKKITDIHFEGTSLKLGIKIIKTDPDVDEFVNFSYRNKWQVNLYVEHSGYDALDIRDQDETMTDDGMWKQVDVLGMIVLKKEKDRVGSRSKIDVGTNKSLKTPLKAITSGEGCSESPNLANSNRKDDRKNQNYNLGSLVTYRWIAHHYAKQLIVDPFIPTLKMKTDIKEKFLINVSLGQCKRAKQRALFDYEGGLKEHYGRLWEYRLAILDSNPGSTCRLDDKETEFGHYYFRRIYVCFKGVKEGWLAGCRKVIGLDGCFLKHTFRRELLVAMGRDANNQMYPIAWAVVKGLLEGVTELLLNTEHKKCTRHLFANYKKTFSRVQLQCLFWNVASTTVEQLYISKMEELKVICPEAYQYLIDRNPNSWCRAYFRQESKKNRMKAQSENNSQVSRLGRKMTCTNCQETGHNKSSCKKEPVPKPPKVPRPPAPRTVYETHASARIRGRGSRGGREMTEDEIRKNLEHDYMEELMLQEEQKLQNYETEQDKFHQEALRLTLEEEAMYKRMDEDRLKEQMAEEEWDREIDYYHPSNWTKEEESFDHEPYNRNAEELEKQVVEPIIAVTPSAEPIASTTHSTDKGKQVAEPQGKKKGSKKKHQHLVKKLQKIRGSSFTRTGADQKGSSIKR
uniref:CCHC-type domain-containing protein n=1 Tax=Tanacetum cinerariifolium TaxID=118510 RepID=A0A699HRC6_TANCI|nr:hypothetical protein CTI12_AA105810 [Tanacetum cinerariifolium]